MATVSCASCGAQVEDTSRFCRACGKPFDASELTTRQLEPEIQYQSPTQTVNQWPTTPAYMSPVQAPAVPATNDLTQGSKNRTVIIVLAATVGLLLFLLLAVMFVSFNDGGPTGGGPTGGGPSGSGSGTSIPGPTPPGVPGVPSAPPAPPAIGTSAIDESLKYPGAEEIMNINHGGGKGMLNLLTKDSSSKVVGWYTARLKPIEIVNLQFGNAILRAGDIAVVISANEDGTNILITRGGD